jgi:hypothetical protein
VAKSSGTRRRAFLKFDNFTAAERFADFRPQEQFFDPINIDIPRSLFDLRQNGIRPFVCALSVGFIQRIRNQRLARFRTRGLA